MSLSLMFSSPCINARIGLASLIITLFLCLKSKSGLVRTRARDSGNKREGKSKRRLEGETKISLCVSGSDHLQSHLQPFTASRVFFPRVSSRFPGILSFSFTRRLIDYRRTVIQELRGAKQNISLYFTLVSLPQCCVLS